MPYSPGPGDTCRHIGDRGNGDRRQPNTGESAARLVGDQLWPWLSQRQHSSTDSYHVDRVAAGLVRAKHRRIDKCDRNYP